MAASDSVDAAWAVVDTATTKLGTQVTKWIAEINKTATDGLNAAQTENVITKLTGLAAALTVMGQDPSNPVPPPQPEPPPMPGPFQPGT